MDEILNDLSQNQHAPTSSQNGAFTIGIGSCSNWSSAVLSKDCRGDV
jgi:hypothetical protein